MEVRTMGLRIASVAGSVLFAVVLTGSYRAWGADCTTGACACGDTIPTNAVVTLTATLTGSPCTTDPALTVADGATLDLGGFTIECDGSFDGVVLSGTGSTLQNGAVTGCVNGVLLGGSGGHFVTNMVVTGSDDAGFSIESNGNKLIGNDASGNDNAGFGIYNSASGNLLRENTASGNFFDGFYLILGSSQNKLLRNVATGQQSSDGFDCEGDNNTFIQNVSTGNATPASEGFEITGTGNKFKSNVASGNGGVGFSVGGSGQSLIGNLSTSNAVGIQVLGLGSGSKLKKNRAMGNASYGIRVFNQDNALTKNVALGNGDFDASDFNAGCDNNAWNKNTFGTSDVDGGGPDPCLQ